jgi:hypothetical protein
MTSIHTQCFRNRGTIASLGTFIWTTSHILAEHLLDFLRANSRLPKLSLIFPGPTVLLETKLLPLLSLSFQNLRSFSLELFEIPNSALKNITTLMTLEQIHLRAGGWNDCWLIDHESMRSCLGSLVHLKRVAFSKDSFDNWISEVDLYYAESALIILG